MNTLSISELPLSGLKKVSKNKIFDNRGYFSRVFCAQALNTLSNFENISQVNLSFTKKKGTIRGLHFQRPPSSENKLIFCNKGAIYDVAVDLRTDSPTFLKYFALVLNGNGEDGILIPKGFAHGFQALEDECEVLYFHSEAYAPEHEDGLNPFDPVLKIEWPLKVTCISERDMNHKLINEKFSGLEGR